MASSRLSHDDYTIAWICALPLEMAAAKAMLDDVHDSLPQPPTDHNTYTLGRLGGHNVVIVCLPSGIYGTTSSATVLAETRSTFPSLQFGLMVGIGGGVPSKVDIRLGDVVVSQPTATTGGVIQYDFGKTISDGRLQRIGCLNNPPQVLLTAVSQIQSDSMSGQRQIRQIIENTLTHNATLNSRFSQPRNDRLFHATCKHQDDASDCSTCDQNQLISRRPRATDEPYIHYGLIASGNQVMKDAQTRDTIADELDILCFEMEAAGLMNQLPCLVIRGICDYCDSHKNKKWQGYAALTAAAYTRELLGMVPVQDRKNHQKSRQQRWMVPFSRNSLFTGRREEITKVENLLSARDGPRKIALTGLGGVGKTQVALELAYRMRDRDTKCSIFWIPSVSHESVEQAYMSMAERLGLQDIHPANVKMRVKAHLSNEKAGQWLLIYDNADDTNMWFSDNGTTTGLKSFLPQCDYGRIIFTSRNRKLANRLAPSHAIPIAEMDEGTARETLRSFVIQKELLDDDTTTIALLRQLTFLPLAIAQAAAYINENGINLSQYLVLLQEQEEYIVELLSEDFEDDGRYADIQNSKEKTDALGLLNAYSFISIQKDESISLHRLVHLAMRNWMREKEKLEFWTCKTADRLITIFPDDSHRNRKLWREYLPHALFLIEGPEFQEEKVKYLFLLDRVGKCLFRDGRYNEAEGLYRNITETCQQMLRPEHPHTLISMGNLAFTYRNQGRWKEAEELHVQVMEMSKQVLGAEHPDTLTSMNNLAYTWILLGRWKEAEELEVQVIETRKQVLGTEHPDTLTSMNNLASTYSNQGRWKEAEELEVQVIETRKQVLGTEHPDTLTSMNNLASTYSNQGRWKKAEELEVQVMEVSKQLLGPEHPHTLTRMNNLASTYQNQGRWKEAEELQVQVVEMSKQVLGAEHPDTLTSMNNLAYTWILLGRWKEAEELEVQVMEMSKQVLGAEHPDTLTSMNNLAYTWKLLGKDEIALHLMTDCVQLRARYLGLEHPNTISSRAALVKWQGADDSPSTACR
ncbi:hypothetical protein BGW36DRAFT_447111 [Talaromyces proteolyticus]|uniref:AAA+ ATPase domain-containing protein n=1 Tax=Talaromyces proteolyticus TaxID=1131652 RepID=A0AAD4KT94_9EURO|nr:uncharacterized protein BGW36DRAFT_447111 [Talaromyces proteolyticus]KAH8700497.1 hypothetical protein BGW36DRAFT_447111 [Talaromyces proteolyticus]